MADSSKFHEKIRNEFASLVEVTTFGEVFWKEMGATDLIKEKKLLQIKVINKSNIKSFHPHC
jgi:hypothetical protein